MPAKDKKTLLSSFVIFPALLGAGGISAVFYLLNLELGGWIGHALPGREMFFQGFLFRFLPTFLLYLGSVFLIVKKARSRDQDRKLLFIILLFALSFRLSLILTTPVLSDDLYRYIWDGRVQMEGINPYLFPPSAEELASFREEGIYSHINRPDSRTVYPAGAQIFFFAVHAVFGDSLYGLKGVLIFLDLLTLLLLIGLLRLWGLAESRVLIYAWNPLVIYEIAHSGHLEGLAVFLIVGAFILHAWGWKKSAISTLAFAAGVKLYPALLLPVFLNRGERIKGVLIFLLSFAVLYLPYGSAGTKLPGFLPTYFTSSYESFNLGLKTFLLYLFPGLGYNGVTLLFAVVLLATALFCFFREKGEAEVFRYAYFLLSLQMVLMPVALHPWYVLPILPFLAFYASPAWLVFSGLVALSYLKYAAPGGVMPLWVLLVEYLPLFFLLLAEPLRRLQSGSIRLGFLRREKLPEVPS